MAAVIDQPVSADTPTRHTRRALSAGLTRLQKRALEALGYIVLVYLLYRLLPALKQALHSLEHVRWEWIVGASRWSSCPSSATSSPGGRSSTGRGCSPPTAGARGPRRERPGRSSAAGCSCRAGHLPASASARGSCATSGCRPGRSPSASSTSASSTPPSTPSLWCSSASAWRSGSSAARAIRCSRGSRQAWPPPGSPSRWCSAGVERRARGR